MYVQDAFRSVQQYFIVLYLFISQLASQSYLQEPLQYTSYLSYLSVTVVLLFGLNWRNLYFPVINCRICQTILYTLNTCVFYVCTLTGCRPSHALLRCHLSRYIFSVILLVQLEIICNKIPYHTFMNRQLTEGSHHLLAWEQHNPVMILDTLHCILG